MGADGVRWDHAMLDSLRGRGDPEADRIARLYRRRHPGLDAAGLVRQVRRDLAGPAAPELPQPELRPELQDAELLARGQRVFQDYGLEMSLTLYLASLPLSYAVLDAAQVLAETSDLATGSLNRRVAETGQMMVDVMAVTGPQPLTPGSQGYATCQGVRLMHAMVRTLVESEGGRPGGEVDHPDGARALAWTEDRVPVSQEAMLGTVLAFTYVAWLALDRIGISLSPAERDAHAYAWSVVAALLGVDQDVLPLTAQDMDELAPLLWERHVHRSSFGTRLAAALLEEMGPFTPLGFGRLPETMIRWLFRGGGPGVDLERIPRDLDIPPAARWLTALLTVQYWTARAATPIRRSAGGRWMFRRLSRWITLGFIERNLEGRPPFRLPPEVASRWRLRQGPVAARARRVRRRTRAGIRARTPAVGARSGGSPAGG